MNNIKTIILIIAFGYSLYVVPQVGIHTKNPIGVLHIDTGKDNPSSGVPNILQQTNDFVVVTAQGGDALVGVGTIPAVASPIQLDLAATNKAILINNTLLESTKDITTIPNPREALLTYNTDVNGVYPDNVTKGLHYYNSFFWNRIETGTKTSISNIRLLQENVLSNATTDIGSGLNVAAIANFGQIKITEQGAYTFALRLYGIARKTGESGLVSVYDRSIFYLYLLKKDAATAAVSVIDMFEINAVIFFVNDALTYTGILRGQLNVGDEVIIKLAHKAPYQWELAASPATLRAARTSLVYWK